MERRREYLVKWVGYPSNKSTWEPAWSLKQCKEHVEKFNRAKEQHRQLQLKLKAGLRARNDQPKPREHRTARKKKNPTRLLGEGDGSPSSSSAGSASRNATPKPNNNGKHVTVLSRMRGVDGEVMFRVKVDDEDYIMQSDDLNKKHPQALLAFYESQLTFK
ncbi:CBN-HPL-2 protein [Aphelenchoides avenae]|nr:CBN-HPL-2 protein [Aphelenchus avenae]